MTRQPHAQLMAIKRWADQGLCAAVEKNLAALSPADASILLLVLDHIHTVDRIFSHHLRGVPHGFSAARSPVLPDFQALAQGIRETDAWYADYAAGLSADELDQPVDFVFTSGKPARMTRGQILLHVCLHGTYHRGNAGAVLQLKGLAPSPDAITDYLEAMAA